jgi:hypothetical protein
MVSVNTRNLGITRRFRYNRHRRPIDELFGVLAYLRSSRTYKREFIPKFNSFITRVEAGSNTSTVTLRVVGGDKKGSLKSETVKYSRKSQGTRTRERLRWQGPAAHTKDRPILSLERVTHEIKNVTVRRIPYSERKKKNLVVSPGWVLYTKTDWPTDRRS